MKRSIIISLLYYCCLINISYAEPNLPEHHTGIYYTIINAATGEILLETGIKVGVNDELITENNRLFRVHSTDGVMAYANFIRNETSGMPWEAQVIPTAETPAVKTIALYHSHTDEAYTPTDGKPSIRGKGSIMKVGDVFAEKLRSLGYTVEHDKALHDPHDANAYIRSRRTVAKLLNQQPAALFDFHRNSAPVSQYKLTLNGEKVAKMVIVVGRANPYVTTTLDFAKQLKAATDAKYPKLVRGIFMANGDYNQDIHPRAILIEIGTEGSTLQEAQKTAALFADSIPTVLGGPKAPPTGAGTTTPGGDTSAPGGKAGATAPGGQGSPWQFGSTIWRNILWIVGITITGSVAYLYISAGSWQAARRKLVQFKNIEFANLLGLRSRKKK